MYLQSSHNPCPYTQLVLGSSSPFFVPSPPFPTNVLLWLPNDQREFFTGNSHSLPYLGPNSSNSNCFHGFFLFAKYLYLSQLWVPFQPCYHPPHSLESSLQAAYSETWFMQQLTSFLLCMISSHAFLCFVGLLESPRRKRETELNNSHGRDVIVIYETAQFTMITSYVSPIALSGLIVIVSSLHFWDDLRSPSGHSLLLANSSLTSPFRNENNINSRQYSFLR